MTKVNNPTLYNISHEQMIKLEQLALKVLGKRSVSALVRCIAQTGAVYNLGDDDEGEPQEALVVPVRDFSKN